MATLTLSAQFQDVWAPNSLGGGTIVTRESGQMIYTSSAGYTVTFHGVELTYDEDGLPSFGLVTGIDITRDGTTFATFTNISVDFAQAGMRVFGYERDGYFQKPTPQDLWYIALRGHDTIIGTSFDDDLRGGDGRDIIMAGAGNDYVGDQSGADTLDGGDGDYDVLSFVPANWNLTAFRGARVDVEAGTATDNWAHINQIQGFESFRDSIFSDRFWGSDGDESVWLTRGNDYFNGRAGWDTADYSDVTNWGAQRGVRVNLETGIVVDSWRGKDTLVGVEEVAGSSLNDTLSGSNFDEALSGSEGNDLISSGGGADTLRGGFGDDTLTGGAGADRFEFSELLVDSGVETITDMQSGIDRIEISSGWGNLASELSSEHLVAEQFRVGNGVTAAETSEERFIYNSSSGDLYFDADGNGTAFAPIRFAVLASHAALSSTDIFVVDSFY